MHGKGEAEFQPTVFIVGDDAQFGQALSRMIGRLELAVEVFNGARSFIDRIDARCCGCVLLELGMPAIGGLGVQDALAARGATIPVIIVTALADVAVTVRAFREGAVDFLQKPVEADFLCDRVRGAVALDAQLRRRRRERNAARDRLACLTPREAEVLDGIVGGLANKQIARWLGITEKTVEVHRARIREKTGARHVPDLVRLVLSARSGPEEPLCGGGKIPMHRNGGRVDEGEAGVGWGKRSLACADAG